MREVLAISYFAIPMLACPLVYTIVSIRRSYYKFQYSMKALMTFVFLYGAVVGIVFTCARGEVAAASIVSITALVWVVMGIVMAFRIQESGELNASDILVGSAFG